MCPLCLFSKNRKHKHVSIQLFSIFQSLLITKLYQKYIIHVLHVYDTILHKQFWKQRRTCVQIASSICLQLGSSAKESLFIWLMLSLLTSPLQALPLQVLSLLTSPLQARPLQVLSLPDIAFAGSFLRNIAFAGSTFAGVVIADIAFTRTTFAGVVIANIAFAGWLCLQVYHSSKLCNAFLNCQNISRQSKILVVKSSILVMKITQRENKVSNARKRTYITHL